MKQSPGLPVHCGFHSYAIISKLWFNSVNGLPTLLGFPYVYNMASGVHQLPFICQYVLLQGLPLVSGFPISHNQVSDVDRLPCIYRSYEGPPDQSGFPEAVDMASLFVGLPHIAGWSCPTATVGTGSLCTQNKVVGMDCQL